MDIDRILNQLRQTSEVIEDMRNDPWLKERRAKGLCTCICHQSDTRCSWCVKWDNEDETTKPFSWEIANQD